MTEFAQDTVKPNPGSRRIPLVLHWLPGAFLLSVVGVGAVLAVTSSGFREFPQDKDVIRGEWMAAYEKNFDTEVPWRQSAVGLWGTVGYRLFGEAREGAIVGQDGWLYTAEEFQTAPGDAAEIAAKVGYVKQVRDELAKDGVKLVVALVPAKARLYPEHLGTVKVPGVKAEVYEDFRQSLEAAGILAPDIFAAMRREKGRSGGALFLRTDTHWTPEGARVTAQTLARTVRGLHLDLPPATFETTAAAPIARKGDLLRYLPVPEGTGPDPDRVTAPTTERTDEGGGGLLGDETIAVTLVGTSYSADTRENVWNFSGALAQALGSEVLNVAREGQGPVTPMREYLEGQDRQNNPPQVVVWEIPERFLRVAYPQKRITP